GAAVGEPGLRAPGHRGLIAIDDRLAELAARGFLLGEYPRQVAGLGIAERVLLPVRVLGVQRPDRSGVVLAPAPFPDLSPAPRSRPCIHARHDRDQYRHFRGTARAEA